MKPLWFLSGFTKGQSMSLLHKYDIWLTQSMSVWSSLSALKFQIPRKLITEVYDVCIL